MHLNKAVIWKLIEGLNTKWFMKMAKEKKFALLKIWFY